MAKQRFVCRRDKEGNPRMVRLDERMVYRPDETVDDFNKRILNAYYQQECEHGSRFKSGFSKNSIKRTFDNAIAEGF